MLIASGQSAFRHLLLLPMSITLPRRWLEAELAKLPRNPPVPLPDIGSCGAVRAPTLPAKSRR